MRPAALLWREETEAYCRERGPRVPRRLVERRHGARPDARARCCRCSSGSTRRRARTSCARSTSAATLPPALAELLDAPVGSKRVDLGGGVQAVREHDRLWLERGPGRRSTAQVEWGPWRIESDLPGLRVRGWRPGDRLAGRSKKIQDVFVDAKIPRSDREGWPLVVRGDEVVAVPGIVEAEGVSATHVAD